MSSTFGNRLKISVFGQSHSAAIGVSMDGLPVGFRPDMDELQAFLDRRAPGNSPLATPRKEPDKVEFLSGLANGAFCGAPLCAVIRNTNVRPGDYSQFSDLPRPGHADFTAQVKYGGAQDASGGGHFSGRLTAPLCIAGGLCLQILRQKGITVGAHLQSIAHVRDAQFNSVCVTAQELTAIAKRSLPVVNEAVIPAMTQAVLDAKAEGDSVGGVIECAVVGLPVGVGQPMFDGLENRIAAAIFGIPAIKGIEFGNGFAAAALRGSENNDAFTVENGAVRTKTNRHGGILGGISTGMPLIFRVAVKPTPSILRPQQTVSLSAMEARPLQITGRHDPCIVPRAVPVVEAVTALVLCDLLL